MNLDKKVQYTLHKSRKRSSLRIKISTAGLVEIYAPSWCSGSYIDEVIAKKYDWIQQKLRIYDTYELKVVHTFHAGDIFYLFGKSYSLEISESTRFSLVCDDTRIHIRIPVTIHSDTQIYIKKKIIAWYRREAKEYLQKRVEYWTTIHEELIAGSHKAEITVRMMRRRWGSCDKYGGLKFNIQLICAPKKFIDCIIVHELCHRLVFNHSREFKDLVHHYIPDYTDYMNEAVKESGLWNIM